MDVGQLPGEFLTVAFDPVKFAKGVAERIQMAERAVRDDMLQHLALRDARIAALERQVALLAAEVAGDETVKAGRQAIADRLAR